MPLEMTPAPAPEATAQEHVAAALGPFADKLDPAALQFIPQKWGSELSGQSKAAITAEVTARLNSPYFVAFYQEGKAPTAPVPSIDRLASVKATLEVMSPQLQPGAPEQLLDMMGNDLAALPPQQIRELLTHRLSTDPKLAHFVKPAPPKYLPGSVEEYAERHRQVNRPTPGLRGLTGDELASGKQPDYTSGLRTQAAIGAGSQHPAELPMETFEQMTARMAKVRGAAPELGFLAGSAGLAGNAKRGR